jgi:hypothetical protein
VEGIDAKKDAKGREGESDAVREEKVERIVFVDVV